jgi:hypothetical protein
MVRENRQMEQLKKYVLIPLIVRELQYSIKEPQTYPCILPLGSSEL